MPNRPTTKKREIVLRGIGVSPGVVTGPVFLMTPDVYRVVERIIAAKGVNSEIGRLEEALIETRRQITGIKDNVSSLAEIGDTSFIDAHLLVLDDRSFIEEIVTTIRDGRRNAEFAVKRVADHHAKVLGAVNDEYLRERVADIRDIARRLVRNLSGHADSGLSRIKKKSVVVAADLAPSETAALRKDKVTAFATNLGSPTSHTALLARALEIPAVVGLHNITEQVQPGDEVLIDGNKGVFIVHPSEKSLSRYGKVARARKKIQKGLTSLQHEPAKTQDGHAIVLSANIEGTEEIDAVKQYGAEGVGLFRSEYLCIAEERILSEEEQYEVYAKAAKSLYPAPVIIRTLDIGGDKNVYGEKRQEEANPFLGCRSIRLSLLHPEQFKNQLRAILRANTRGNVKIMFPMISNVNEIVQAKELLEQAKEELVASKTEFGADIEVGVMIEIPAAAVAADAIAENVDFFSLGTNDLIQYTLAVDRVNENVAYLYEPTHPAVLELIKRTVDAGHRKGIWVGLCGEMAADPMMTPLLLGLGIDELSVPPSAVPLVKDAIRSVQFSEAEKLSEVALSCTFASDVLGHCRKLTKKIAPELLELI